jgi:hypothetical protein
MYSGSDVGGCCISTLFTFRIPEDQKTTYRSATIYKVAPQGFAGEIKKDLSNQNLACV